MNKLTETDGCVKLMFTRSYMDQKQMRGEVDAALSYLLAKTLKQLAKETGLPLPVVRKEVDRLFERGLLEERGGFYRCQNTSPWRNYI